MYEPGAFAIDLRDDQPLGIEELFGKDKAFQKVVTFVSRAAARVA